MCILLSGLFILLGHIKIFVLNYFGKVKMFSEIETTGN